VRTVAGENIGCKDFGFNGARLQLRGKVWEHRPDEAAKPCWQLRIPLQSSDYINFNRLLDPPMHPMVLTSFAEVVERITKSKFLEIPALPLPSSKTPEPVSHVNQPEEIRVS
jgi:hypothetical protein